MARTSKKEEMALLRAELRRFAIRKEMILGRHIGYACQCCGCYWTVGKEEHHLGACLARGVILHSIVTPQQEVTVTERRKD